MTKKLWWEFIPNAPQHVTINSVDCSFACIIILAYFFWNTLYDKQPAITPLPQPTPFQKKFKWKREIKITPLFFFSETYIFPICFFQIAKCNCEDHGMILWNIYSDTPLYIHSWMNDRNIQAYLKSIHHTLFGLRMAMENLKMCWISCLENDCGKVILALAGHHPVYHLKGVSPPC